MKKRGRSAPPPPLFLLSTQQKMPKNAAKSHFQIQIMSHSGKKRLIFKRKNRPNNSKRRKTESARGLHARRGSQGRKDKPRQISPFSLSAAPQGAKANDLKKAPWNPYGKREKRGARRRLILLETIETFFTAGIDRERISVKNIFQHFNCLQIIH